MKNKNLLTVLFFIFLILTSCVSIKPLAKSELMDITERRKSLVLLRVTCDIAGKLTIESSSGCIAGENATIAMGNFDTGGELKQIVPLKSFSAETLKQGWIYWVLEPGIYYIGFQGQRRTDAFTYDAQWKHVKRYRIDVQPDSPGVYVGTMHLECRSDWFLFGAKYCCFIDNQIVRNDETQAQKLVSENLKEMSRPITALMQLHTEKTLFFRTPKVKK